MKIPDIKKLNIWVIIAIIFVAVVCLSLLFFNAIVPIFLLAILFFAVILLGSFLILSRFHPTRNVETWAQAHQFRYFESTSNETIYSRIRANPKKRFFTADQFLENPTTESGNSTFAKLVQQDMGIATGPYVEGVTEKHRLWFYPMFDKVSFKNQELKFYGWCMEFETHTIPSHVFVSKKYINQSDTHDTESNEFEKKYAILADPGSSTLQLLDPVMMGLILESNISSIDFSDSSIVLTTIANVPSRVTLEKMLSWGTKIAKQVDSNFPLH